MTSRKAARLNGGPLVVLADGTMTRIPPDDTELFRGLDRKGRLVYAADWNPDYLYALTECCLATAKGSMGATVCRACYREIDPTLGGEAEVAPGKSLHPDERLNP